MRTKILTLRFSPQVGGFDDGPLLALQQKVVLTQLREHLVQVGGEAMLVCVAEWREQPQGTGVVTPRVETPNSHRPVRAETEPASHESLSPAVASTQPAACAPAPPDAGYDKRDAHGPASPVGELRADLTDEQRVLFDRVRSWRSRTAQKEGAPPYVILTNRQLVELVRQRPDSKAGIGRIHGLGDKKVARHGEALLRLLWSQPADPSGGTEEPRGPVDPVVEPTAAAMPSEQETPA